MNQIPRKNHFVPKIYLKRFVFDGKKNIYKIPIKSKFKKIEVKNVSISSICYKPDFYTIRTQELMQKYNLQDSYFIEKKAFDYENIFLKEQLDRISLEKEISYLNAKKILEVILDIKRRNQFFKNYFEDENLISSVLEKQLTAFEKVVQKNDSKFKANGIESKKFLSKVKSLSETKFGNQDFLNDLYLESFLDKESADANMVKHLSTTLSKLTFYIFRTTPNYPFITNDNPGSTLLNNDRIRNASFSNWQVFSFPIDPIRLLIIVRTDKDKSKGVFKKIKTRMANQKFVDLANKAAVINCNKLIISNQQLPLEKLKNKFHKYYLDPTEKKSIQ